MSQSGTLKVGGSGGGDVNTLTGNTGGAVGPDGGGNINVVGTGSISVAGDAGDNTLTISVSGTGFTWNLQSSNLIMAANNGYITNSSSGLTFTLPTDVPFGSAVWVVGDSSGGWTIAQQADQQCTLLGDLTTLGTGGSITSTNPTDAVQLVCFDNTGDGLAWIATIIGGNPVPH